MPRLAQYQIIQRLLMMGVGSDINVIFLREVCLADPQAVAWEMLAWEEVR